MLKPENVLVRMGESAQFYCQAKGDPPPSVNWSREQGSLPNGRYLPPDKNMNKLWSEYTVSAMTHGTEVFIFKWTPRIVKMIQSSFVICCMFNLRYLVNPDQTLQIHYVTTEDAGKYICTAANDIGEVTVSAQLLVEGQKMSHIFALDVDVVLSISNRKTWVEKAEKNESMFPSIQVLAETHTVTFQLLKFKV